MLNAPHKREGAFTLMEMVIAMVVLGVLIAAVFPLVGQISRAGGRDSARNNARNDARTHAQTLEADLRAIRAPLRPTGDGEELVSVIGALNGGSASLPLPAAAWPDVPTATLWGQRTYSDLLFAGPTALMFWADVLQNPPGAFQTEMVRWYLVNGTAASAGCPNGTTWCLVREVRYATNANASASAAIREVLSSGSGGVPMSDGCFPGAPAASQATPRIFCYQAQVPGGATPQYRWNTWTATCRSAWTGVTPDPNALTGSALFRASALPSGSTRPGVSQLGAQIIADHEQAGPLWGVRLHPLDRITTIAAVVPGGGSSNGTSDAAASSAEVAVPSRSSTEYRTAILCGDR